MTSSIEFPDESPSQLLEDKICIVAGGGRGIGKATAFYLADAGATVVVNDLGTDPEGTEHSDEPATQVVEAIRERGGTAQAHFGDITSLEYTEQLIEDTVDQYGRVDGIINYAGVLADTILYKMSGDQWDRVIDVHLRGHFSLLRNVAAHWRERAGDGQLDTQRSFVTVTSRSALGNPGQANYAAAKSGIMGLTWTAAAELKRLNVRVNSLMPTAYTRMIEEIPEEKRPFSSDEMPPEKVAPIAAYLMSDEAEDINGCIVRAAGDAIGLVSEPSIDRLAYQNGGWTLDDIADRFRESVGSDVSLDRTQ